MKKWGAIAAVALIGLAGAGGWLAVRGPELVRERLQLEIRQALGPEAELGAFEVDGNALVLHGLALEGPGLPLDARVYFDTLRVEGDLRSLLTRGTPQLRSVEVVGGALHISRVAVRERLRALREGHASEPEATGTAAASTAATRSFASLQRRLATLLYPGAAIVLRDFEVNAYEDGQLEPLVLDLDLELRDPLRGEGRLVAEGIALAPLQDLLGPIPGIHIDREAHLSARIDGFAFTSDTLSVRGRVSGNGVSVAHARLRAGPVALPTFEAEGDATWRRQDGHLEIGNASVSLASERGRVGYAGTAKFQPFQLEGRLAAAELDLALLEDLLGPLPWLAAGPGARVSARIDSFALGPDAAHARGALSAHDLIFEHAAVHDAPVPLPPFRAEGEARWERADGTLRVESARVESGEVAMELAGALEWKDGPARVALEAQLPETSCDAALGVVPETLLGRFQGFAWTGRIGGSLSLVADVHDPDASRIDLAVDERCHFERIPESVRLARFDGPFLHTVRGHGEVLHRFRTGPGHPNWTRLDEVSPFFVHAVLAHEDAAFLHHAGFAPWAMANALKRNLEEGRFAYGASTISMQLAKNLFLERSKQLDRKLQEVLLTWWLEENLAKREILELYLNVIEYGPGVFGIRDAADHYFGRAPAQLSAAESAFLASILPAPTTRHVYHERGELSPWMRGQVAHLLNHMHRRDRIDAEALDAALAELGAFRFRPHGGPRPGPRGLLGEAQPLPFETAAIPRAVEPDPSERFRKIITAGSSPPRHLRQR